MVAVFAVAPVRGQPGYLAGTTRPREPGRVGLPGGKVEPGETLLAALLRECREEGWEITRPHPDPIHVQEVDGAWVLWFAAAGARRLPTFKEQGRVEPVLLTPEAVLSSGYGNDRLPEWLLRQLAGR